MNHMKRRYGEEKIIGLQSRSPVYVVLNGGVSRDDLP